MAAPAAAAFGVASSSTAAAAAPLPTAPLDAGTSLSSFSLDASRLEMLKLARLIGGGADDTFAGGGGGGGGGAVGGGVGEMVASAVGDVGGSLIVEF